jgi:hypothetical protein
MARKTTATGEDNDDGKDDDSENNGKDDWQER